uniref:Putative tail protein n=1 Tax=viral metagenome TaxID=1070528 RepID=A0A6M3K0N9_9ZZZZ
MATPFSQTAFNAKATQSAIEATALKYDRLTLAEQGAARGATSFADATGRGRITLENFGRTFDNATRKVLIWQLAIMAVYGAIRKIGETIQTWKDLEVTLARISITTGAVGERLQKYFRQVADVAIEFGMPIEQTLTGMDLALRATARYAEQANRGAIAVTLLRDASALANIAGMQYSQAIDILVGSLRQSDMELDQGIRLLDKWVAVAKNAAVSVNDLSQGFAIMADAGRAAGLSVDQINGLIAALSETVTLGPVEIGNAIRALMSTLYNPGSISLMQKFGVAVRDTQGEVRSFWEVMQQLSAMREAGVLDESIWLEIAKAAGAGQRRYAQFLALLNNFSTAMRVANVSATAEGQAMQANQKIVDTLTNTWDKFTASQRKFLFLMGEQTGAIEDLTGAIQGLANFFDMLAGAGEGVYKLGRAVMFLVGTLTALKVATLAMGWMGVGPKVGAVMGRFAGVPPTAIAGSAAYAKAIQAGGYTSVKAAQAAGLGTIAPGVSSQAGMYALSGLLPAFMMRRMFGGGPPPVVPGVAQVWRPGGGQYVGGAWQAGGGRWAAPTVPRMTWGGAARGAGQWMTRPMGGMGAAVGGLAAGAAAYGLTGEWQSAVGAGIGSAFGAAVGGPIGMVAGGLIGTAAGHIMADAFISREDRLKKVFEKLAEDFTIDLSTVMERYFQEAGKTLEDAREAARLSAPTFPGTTVAQAQPLWERLIKGGVSLGGPISPANQYSFTPFGRPGAKEWEEGLGAMDELNIALATGVITMEEYTRAKKDDYIAWNELTDSAKAYMVAVRGKAIGVGVEVEAFKATSAYIKELTERTRNLSQVSNDYTMSQQRIKELMETTGSAVAGVTLKEWEQQQINELLGKQLQLTAEDYKAYYDALLGASYGYAAHLESIERLQKVASEFGVSLEAIPIDKWLLVQKWDTSLATDIVQTTTSVAQLSRAVEEFRLNFPDILKLADMTGTINDIDVVRSALERLQESTGDVDQAKRYGDAIAEIDQYLGDVMQRDIDLRRLGALGQVGAGYTPPTEVRLVDAETLRAYREQLGQLPAFTALAESLKKFDTSIITLVDPVTQETLRLEANTLALQLLGNIVGDNTKAQEKRFEAEYNLPSGYARPSRYWYYRTTGSTEFGPSQESLWVMWENFVKERGRAGGGGIPETGAYYLHRGESVLGGDMLTGTNNILIGSHQVLVNSQNYLSQINMGIISLREEVASLRNRLGKVGVNSKGAEFSRVAGAGQGGDIPTFGARGLLD